MEPAMSEWVASAVDLSTVDGCATFCSSADSVGDAVNLDLTISKDAATITYDLTVTHKNATTRGNRMV